MRKKNAKWNSDRPLRAGLPPLDLLRGFEAAARHLSFSAAARDLFLTQSAISRQIIALEESLGVELFRRGHRSLALTEAGEVLYGATREVLERLRNVTARLRAPQAKPRVTLTTVPGFASLWLIPRLEGFARVAPDVDVRISVSHALLDLDQDHIDLAVRYCSPAAGVGRILFEEQFLPVCAPSLLTDAHPPLRSVADLARHTFLDMATHGSGAPLLEWDLWLRSVQSAGLRPARTVSFSHYDAVITAASAGQGIAIGRLPLISRYLEDGRLVAPFAGAQSSTKAYLLLESSSAVGNPAAGQFAAWLLEESRTALGVA
jgi:DNA-binding transcriptional LysR family regulator